MTGVSVLLGSHFAQFLFHNIIKINELKIAIASNEINHRETLNMISEKTKENSFLKNELNNMKQANDAIMDQVT